MKRIIILAFLAALLTACGAQSTPMMPGNEPGGMGMGPGGMSERHHAQIPEAYQDAKSPELNDAMLADGAEIYEVQCASCHGETGMGDGPAAESLDPAPAPVAHTSQMLGDAYLFWRTSEGGAQFSSSMPGWKDSLTEDEIWSVIGYLRILGTGEAARIHAMQHEEMLAAAINQGFISEADVETFNFVHDALDAYHTAHRDELSGGSMDEHQVYMLSELVKAGEITQSQADDFARIHQLLMDEGLMH